MGRSSPTLNLIVVSAALYVLQTVWLQPGELALVWPVDQRPWTLLTSVFAHAGPFHLVSNMLALGVVGLLLERRTSPLRFYIFFVASGAVAGTAEVAVAAAVGTPYPAVVGASGAVFALLGYLLSSNRLTDRTLAGVGISARVQLGVFLLVATAVSIATLGQRVAVVAHFTGLLCGLLSGRTHLLRSGGPESDPVDPL